MQSYVKDKGGNSKLVTATVNKMSTFGKVIKKKSSWKLDTKFYAQIVKSMGLKDEPGAKPSPKTTKAKRTKKAEEEDEEPVADEPMEEEEEGDEGEASDEDAVDEVPETPVPGADEQE